VAHLQSIQEVQRRARQLRQARQFEQAHQLVHQQAATCPALRPLLWEHQPILWSDIQAGICQLTRRQGADAEFVQHLWQDPQFVYSFHRQAAPIPQGLPQLANILEQEFLCTVGEAQAMHWIVRDKQSRPWGLISLTDISLVHKKAEVMLGVLPHAPLGLSAAAMLVLFQFVFKALKFNKLYSFVYEDNAHSLKGTLHLGFEVEGRLRQHVLDPQTGAYVDLIQTGLLAQNAFSPRTQKLMRRLLA
jgi:RimJ/RimL family protein N-acetyltransferase